MKVFVGAIFHSQETKYTQIVNFFMTRLNPFIDLQSKSMDWFLYDMDCRHERVKFLEFSLAFKTAPYSGVQHFRMRNYLCSHNMY